MGFLFGWTGFAAIYTGSRHRSWHKKSIFRAKCDKAAQAGARTANGEQRPERGNPPLFAIRYSQFALSGVGLALRIDDLLELAEHVHARQHLPQAAVRLALLLDGGNELAILELDVLAVAEVVVERLVGAVVADIAEERAERAVVVERQRERQDRARRHLGHDSHIHGDVELRVNRPLHGVAIG